MLDFTLHFATLPLQKYTSEWDEKMEEGQILLSRDVTVLSISNKADHMGMEITYPTWIQFWDLIYSFGRNLLERL